MRQQFGILLPKLRVINNHDVLISVSPNSPTDHDVFDGYIPMFVNWRGGRYPGNLHIFVKARNLDRNISVRGSVFFELVDGPLVSFDHGMHYLSLPNMFRNLSMKIIHRRSNSTVIPLPITYRPCVDEFTPMNQCAGIPGAFQFSLPLHSVDYRIAVDGATRVIDLDYILTSAKRDQAMQETRWITVLHPMKLYPVPVEMQIELVVTHILHHLRVGGSGTAWYVRRHHIIHLQDNGTIQRLIRERKLYLVGWDIFSQPENEGSGFDSVFVKHHAALSYWGEKTWLLFIDVDEFLALPPPTSTISNAMLLFTNARPCWLLQRQNVFHSNEKSRNMNNKYRDVFDVDNWSRMRALYNASGLGSAVWQLTFQREMTGLKPFMNPDQAFFGFVHEAWELLYTEHLVLGPDARRGAMSFSVGDLRGCNKLDMHEAYVAHNVNAFGVRAGPAEEVNDAWLWAYPEPLNPGGEAEADPSEQQN